MIRSIGLALVVTLAASGCVTSYYKQPDTQYQVATGADTGARGDVTWVQPAIVEYVLSQPESGLIPYYEQAQFAPMQSDVSIFKKQIYMEAAADLRAIEASDAYAQVQREPPLVTMQASPRGIALGRAAARILAPHVARALQEKGYARVSWGRKLDGNALGMAMHTFHVTAHKGQNVVQLTVSDVTSTFAMPKEVKFDVSAVPGAFDAGQQGDLAAVKAKVKKL